MKGWKKTAVLMTAVLAAGLISPDPPKTDVTGFAGINFIPGTLVVSATSSTQQKIDEAEERRKQLENEKNKQENELNQLQGEQKGLRKELNNLNAQLNQVVANLEELEQQIRDKEQEILETQAALEEAEATERWQYECMVERARALYEMQDESYVNALLKEGSIAGVLNAADYIERVAAYERQKMDEYTATRVYIEEQEARLQGEREDLDGLKLQAETEKDKVQGLIRQTANAIADYGDQIADAE